MLVYVDVVDNLDQGDNVSVFRAEILDLVAGVVECLRIWLERQHK